jgi:inner membrane protein
MLMTESRMDSLTQLALGSAVGVAVMGRRAPIWKAAVWGGVCGTLPDLDVFLDHGDAIRNMTLHRTESHSLFFLTLVSPALALLASRFPAGTASFKRWWLAVWLALITHPLLDWMTIYGTQLALPFSDFPFAVGNIFVIDPLYTLPLIAGLVAAMSAARRRPGSGRRWNLLGLAVATAYLAWSGVAQVHVSALAETSLRQQGIAAERVLVVPTPFNTVLWRVLAIDGDSYLEGFYSLLDRDRNIAFSRHSRGQDIYEISKDNWYVARMAWFSHGFFRMQREGETILISDLRMGQEPSYTFTFRIPGAMLREPPDLDKPTLLPQQLDIGASLQWLWQRLLGKP